MEFYAALTEWLSNNLEQFNDSSKINLFVKGAFGLQKEFFKDHFKELIKTFYTKKNYTIKTSFSQQELAMIYIPDMIAHYAKTNENTPPIKEEKQKVEQLIQKPKKRVKKKPLITEISAERFLLETVFNIPPTLLVTIFSNTPTKQ